MSLEAGAFGPLADKAIDQAINAGQLTALLELIASPPEGAQAGADLILARLTRPENLKGMFTADRVDLRGLDHLLPRLSIEGYEPLLEALGASPNRMVRRRLLDLLSRRALVRPAQHVDAARAVPPGAAIVLGRALDEASRPSCAFRGHPPAADARARIRSRR
jgi:hypothetical protein